MTRKHDKPVQFKRRPQPGPAPFLPGFKKPDLAAVCLAPGIEPEDIEDAEYLPSRLGLACPNRDCRSTAGLLVRADIGRDPENKWDADSEFDCDCCGAKGRLRHLKRQGFWQRLRGSGA